MESTRKQIVLGILAHVGKRLSIIKSYYSDRSENVFTILV